MPKVRANTHDKWARRTASATQEFTEGVQNPSVDWAQATAASAPAQAAGVQAAIQAGSFAKGVQKAGSSRWQQKTLSKGAQRFSQGVTEAVDDYKAGVAPYLKVIEDTQLPARGPKGDPKNYQRVVILGQALRAKKMGK